MALLNVFNYDRHKIDISIFLSLKNFFICSDFLLAYFNYYSWVARDVTKNQTKKLSILLSFYFHEVLQYLNIFT